MRVPFALQDRFDGSGPYDENYPKVKPIPERTAGAGTAGPGDAARERASSATRARPAQGIVRLAPRASRLALRASRSARERVPLLASVGARGQWARR